MVIYYDTREKTPFTLTEAWKGVETERITMKTADYTNGVIKIERKGIGDLIGTLGRGRVRFMKEVDRGFDHLVIEGTREDIARYLKKRHSRMSINYIMLLLHIIEGKGIKVHLCDGREAAAELALNLLQA